jgi:hypothetical protein
MRYEDDQSAARGLLGEAVQILTGCDVEFAVVGGWRPFLSNSEPIPHPGTFDVDVLLRETTTRRAFDAAAAAFLQSDYMRAPKNKFQAHRVLNVAGEHLVFHVDFLHRKYAPDADDLVMEWGKFQSIAGPGTDVVFIHDEVKLESVPLVLPSGIEATVTVPIATEIGILATKGRSAGSEKRLRDAFDIFLVVTQSKDRAWLVQRCRVLMRDGLFEKSFRAIVDGFTSGRWSENAARYLAIASPAVVDPLVEVQAAMAKFFLEVESGDRGSA